MIVDPPPGTVTWIKVERPFFDLAGILWSSLSLTGLLALGTVVLGSVAGIAIIVYRRRHPDEGGMLRLRIARS